MATCKIMDKAKARSCRYGLWARVVNVAALMMVLIGGAAAAETKTLVAVGDSLTAGLGLPAEQAFPAKLEAALRSEGMDVRVINAGVSGDTTAGGRARLAWTLGSGPVDGVILELGANDGLRGIDPKTTRGNLAAMLTVLQKRNLPVLLTGMMAPPNLGKAYGQAFNAMYPALASEYGVLFYPFFLEGVAAKASLNQDDGIHPNAQGVDEIVKRILPRVKDLLAATTP